MEAGPSGVSDTVGGEGKLLKGVRDGLVERVPVEEVLNTGSRGPCKRCLKAGHECTFDYEFKRSGRPPG